MPANERFQREFLEFQSRLTDGVGVMSGLGEIKVGTTPKNTVHSENTATLYRYLPLIDAPPRSDVEPILIVYALVNRPYITDLYEQRSLVRGLLHEGRPVYLIDWGCPGPGDRYQDMSYYVEGLINRCVDETMRDSGTSKLNILGICQGGTMSLCYAALHPDKVRNLVTMITPVDFHTPDNLLSRWFRNIDVDLLVDAMGNVSGVLLNSIFLSLKPFRLGIEKYLDFVDVIDQPEKVENFMRMEKWIFDSPDQAGEMFRTFLKDFFHDNKFVEGGLTIGDRKVDLKSVTMPVLNIFAKQDHLVPPSSSQALRNLTGTDDYTEIGYDTGHIGIYVSARAGLDIPLRISGWLDERP